MTTSLDDDAMTRTLPLGDYIDRLTLLPGEDSLQERVGRRTMCLPRSTESTRPTSDRLPLSKDERSRHAAPVLKANRTMPNEIRPDVPDFRFFACDTNCLVATAPRRVMMALADTIGQRTLVLPQVHTETTRNIVKLTKHHVRRKLSHAMPLALSHQAQSAAGIAAAHWWNGECTRNDSPIVHLDPTNTYGNEYDAEFARLPEDAFTDGSNHDRAIIAQAIVHQIPIVVSHNFNSIDREILERAADLGVCGRADILTMREALDRIALRFETDPAEHLLGTIAGVVVSEKPRPYTKDMDSIRNLVENLALFERSRRVPRGRTLSHLAIERIEEMEDDEVRALVRHGRATRPDMVRAVESRRLMAQAQAIAGVRGIER